MLSNPITEPQIPGAIARDTETAAAMTLHVNFTDPHPQYLTQSEGNARYRQTAVPLTDADIPMIVLRGRTFTATIDPPSIGAQTLYKVFFTMPANVGDWCHVVPTATNLFTTAAWPFVFSAVVEAGNTVGFYLRNDHSGALDLASLSLKFLIVNS